jgi:hypothetical protein
MEALGMITGGGGRIRTFELIRGQIYSLLVLTITSHTKGMISKTKLFL